MTTPSQPTDIQIKADDETMTGRYSNSVRITHSLDDVVLDFMYIHGNPPFGKLLARMIVSPGHAKRLMVALKDNLNRYESVFGKIKDAPVPPPAAGGFVQ